MQQLRRSLVTGLVVTVPLVISIAAFVWLFQLIDGVMVPVYARWLGREIPGLGLVTLLAIVVVVGAVASNVPGGRLLQRGEAYLLKLPVFRAVYGPVKQLVTAFSPDNQMGFKRVVLVDDPRRGLVLGFLTKQFVLDRGTRTRGAGLRICSYQPHLLWRHSHLFQRRRVLPGSLGAGGGPDLSDWRHGLVTERPIARSATEHVRNNTVGRAGTGATYTFTLTA